MAKNDLEISAMSYVNKDFGSIYPEILDIARQLTNEWDPANSNESDPGVVLLKEAAFVADHNNYNIDKNILENFLPSATQDISVRNICEMNGYTPRYYTSAIGDISFVWTPSEEESELPTSFTIPAFTLTVSDADETVTYTQIENLVVNDSGSVSCKFIEGTLQTLTINDSSIITLEDLDDNNRVYFPEVMVAQNRVYVRNYNSADSTRLLQEDDYWIRDNYLLTRPSGTKAFKVDYDSTMDLPYIEFPSDISSIIEDGIIIEYISTSGKNGNINANTISKILSPTSYYAIGEEAARPTSALSVFNSGSITNGKDPETIEEMYRSFRKVVGTFDTLVTCKDYKNAIYMMTDGFNNDLVSNVYVTDRRSEYNKAINMISYDFTIGNQGFANLSIKPCSLTWIGESEVDPSTNASTLSKTPGAIYLYNGNLYINMSLSPSYSNYKQVPQNKINLNDFALLTEAMTPYDLSIYALKAFSLGEYISYAPEQALNNSFKPVSKTILNDAIKIELELNKCLSHNYNDPTDNDIFLFKNYVPLNVEIEPYNKIKSNEESQILNNVYRALSENFNPRYLEFGEKLEVEDLKKVMIGADSRIKSVKINPLEYNTKIMMGDDKATEHEIDYVPDGFAGATVLVDLIAKNVLAGRVCLFNFEDSFNFNYGQQGLKSGTAFNSVFKDVTKVASDVRIKITPSDSSEPGTSSTEKEYLKLNTKYTVRQIAPNITNYGYLFKAPNFKNAAGAVQDLAVNASYTLTGTDEFIIYKIDPENVSNVTSLTFKSDDVTQYTITNKTTGVLKNTPNSTARQYPAVGSVIEITVDTEKKSYELGTVNLENYTLNENEIIQILSPNYISDTTYSMYVNYKYINSNNPTAMISPNVNHTLQTGEKIILVYTVEGVEKQTILKAGDVVSTNFNLYVTDELSSNVSRKEWVDEDGELKNDNFKQLTSNQTISTKKLMQTKLNGTDIWCYWILDRGNTVLFDSDETERILGANEYFIYTNSSLNEMIILGAGTKLQKPAGSNGSWWVLNKESDISIESITKYGTSIQEKVSWKKGINFAMYPMYITEMSVITLGEGDRISIFGWEEVPEKDKDSDLNTKTYLDYNWIYCNGTIQYKASSSDEVVTLPRIEDFYQIRSRLDINMSANYPQRLNMTVNTNEGETDIISIERLTLSKSGTSDQVITSKKDDAVYVQTSAPLYKIGGTIDLKTSPIDFYGYTLKKDPTTGEDIKYNKTFVITKGASSLEYDLFIDDSCGTYILPIHISGRSKEVTVEIFGSNGSSISFDDYNSGEDSVNSMKIIGTQSYYIHPNISSNVKDNIIVKFSWGSGDLTENEAIVLGDIVLFDGINKNIRPNNVFDSVLKRMRNIISNSDKPSTKYYYPYKPDNTIIMDNLNFEDANALWDVNNVVNSMTLPQIDIVNSNIKVISSMKRD